MGSDFDDKTTDEALMARFCTGLEEEPFQELVRRYMPPALAVASGRVGRSGSADDAVQETFIRVVRERDRYDPSRPFAPWFYTILRNICTDSLRKQIRYRDKLKDAVAGRPAVGRTDTSGIHEALSELPDPDREVLLLRLVQELSFRDISEVLDCSEDAAKKRAQRALRKLKEKLS